MGLNRLSREVYNLLLRPDSEPFVSDQPNLTWFHVFQLWLSGPDPQTCRDEVTHPSPIYAILNGINSLPYSPTWDLSLIEVITVEMNERVDIPLLSQYPTKV